MESTMNNEQYHALVDMGSNGIRFSISDLSPPKARVLPTVYQDRCDISLYDAQYQGQNRIPIPQSVIDDILHALLQFRQTCQDFRVPTDRIRIVATEATRTSINCVDFLGQIKSKMGFEVELLAKEDEGRIGALGIASSFHHVKGLVMDLGGGSVQFTWMETDNGSVSMGTKGSISLPYGAAALMKKLEQVDTPDQYDLLQQQLISEIKKVIQDLDIHYILREQSDSESGLQLFLSGGGFRGWGYVLMSKHIVQPYPIPIINGFSVTNHEFHTSHPSSTPDATNSTFRISSRRSSQIPAISLLVTAVTLAVPSRLKYTVHFAQGGVREGLLFSTLPPSIRSTNPLIAATTPHAPQSANALFEFAKAAIPPDSPSSPFTDSLLRSLINLLHTHASHPKDIRASSALRGTTTGLLASAHGIDHHSRALLALTLAERWRDDIPPTDHDFHSRLQQLVGPDASFWALYLGRVLHGLGDLFPAGFVREGVLKIGSRWGVQIGGKNDGEAVLQLQLRCQEEKMKAVEGWARDVEKLGKKKNWIGGGGGGGEEGGKGGFKIQCFASLLGR